MKKFIKWGAIIICILFVVVAISGYVVYRNRAAITHKVVEYTMQSIVGNNDDGQKTWLGTFFDSQDGKSLKNNLLASVLGDITKNTDNITTSADKDDTKKNRRTGLATIAEMLLNGAGGDGADIKQTAQILLNTLGNSSAQNYAQNSDFAPQHDINARDTKGRTLLMNVCRVDVSPKVIKMLLRYGAQIDAVDENGRSALMYAAALNEDPEVVQILLENGADATVKDNNGYTAYEHAKNDEVRAVLQKYQPKKYWWQ